MSLLKSRYFGRVIRLVILRNRELNANYALQTTAENHKGASHAARWRSEMSIQMDPETTVPFAGEFRPDRRPNDASTASETHHITLSGGLDYWSFQREAVV